MCTITSFTINGKEQNAEVFWGEKVTIAWEIASSQEILTSALLYPYHWPITQAKGSRIVAVYAPMDFVCKVGDSASETNMQKSLTVSIREGAADSEIYVTMRKPKQPGDPIARVRVEYTNGAYGYCSRGISRVDQSEFNLYAGASGKQYEFTVPYQNQRTTGIGMQEFDCWLEA